MNPLGLLGGGMSLPMILGAAAAALTALGGLLVYGNHLWEEHKTALRNEGSMQCVNAVRDADHNDLKSKYAAMMKKIAADQERMAAVERENAQFREASKKGHEEIAASVKGRAQTCTFPDAAIDAANRQPKAEAPAKGGPLK